MVSDVNRLAELVELDSLPAWIREEIESKREEIIQKLQSDGVFVIQGPDGKQVTLRPKAKMAAA
jgi:hypothetical protein